MESKRCFKCFSMKPLSEFYAHKQMADGFLNKCKDCTKRDARARSKTNPHVQEYDRKRSKLPHRKRKREEYAKQWDDKHPIRRKAQDALSNAVRDGRVTKEPCLFCGETKRVEGHHHDYTKPLDVTWLCVKCHRRLHGMEATGRIKFPFSEAS